MRRALILTAVATAAISTTAVSAGLASGPGNRDADDFGDLRRATSRFRDVDDAVEAGYVQFFGCVHEPLAGSMGIHYVNGTLAGDTELDPSAPEALTYEVQPNGRLALVGVEHVVFQSAWDADHDAPPELFGQPFHLVPEPNRYGIPAFYALHTWAWKDNPAGAHEDWNPAVVCVDPDV